MRPWILLTFALFIVGCNSAADQLIPASYTSDAIQNIETIVKELDVKDNRLKVTGAVPYDIKREQVIPSLLFVLKKTLKEHPSSKYIFVTLGPDMESALFGYAVGSATFENKKIKILCKIPTDQQMKEHNSRIGKMESGGIFGDDAKHPVVYSGPHLFVPDKVTFLNNKRIAIMIYDKAISKYDLDDRYKIISQETGLPLMEVKDRFLFFEQYYGISYPGSGEEFKPNL